MLHPIDTFLPSRAPATLGSTPRAFGANQPLVIEQKLEGATIANAPKVEVSVVKLEGRPGRLFVLKHLEARCDQPLSAYRVFNTTGSSDVLIQPTDMHPDSAPRCNALYTVSFYVDGEIQTVSQRGDFYGNPDPKPETIWTLDWTHVGALGSAIACAKGVVLPADFMASGQTNPVPQAKPGPKGILTIGQASTYVPWVLGAVAVGGVAWWAWTSGALAGVVAANPHGRSISDILERAGWSRDLADRTMRSSGVARTHNGLLYVLTSYEGEAPSDPREPTVVGVYAEDRGAGEWVPVGMREFPDLRNALQRWNTVQADMMVVRELGAGVFKPNPARNPGRARKLGLRPSDFDPRELKRGTKHELEHTDDEVKAQQITMDHLAETWERAYKQAKKVGAPESAARAHAFDVLKHARYYGHLDEAERLQGEEEQAYALERGAFRENP